MKQRFTYTALLLISSCIFSCTQENSNVKEVSEATSHAKETEAQPADEPLSEESRQELVRECEAYWAERKKLNARKADYFEKNVLAKALATPEVSEQNRKFLLDLKVYLRQSVAERSELLAPRQLLFPIFKLNKDELGIVGLPAYDYTNHSLIDISEESRLLSQHQTKTDVVPHTETEVVFHKAIADSLFKQLDRVVYTFTAQKPVKTQLQHFGSYTGECLEYYLYQLDAKPFDSQDKVMFGSRYNLNLTYKNHPEIDKLYKEQSRPQCADCPNSDEFTTTFANLTGVEDLYFTYADTFPLNNQLNTPSRGLVMKMDDKLVYLWYAEVDLVGCSCI